jgi:hypothetical protein
MAKFVLTHSGGGPMPETDVEREAVMSAWMSWFGGLGAAVVDAGNPFGDPFGGSSTVTAGGVADGTASSISGYSILDAADLASAAEMAKACPTIGAGGIVEVHEALDIM